MSIETMVWVLHHSPTTGTDKVILLGLANHADPEGKNAWPSVATLARYANVTRRRVQQSLRQLESGGHIVVIPNAGGSHVVRDDRRPNLYEVVTDGAKLSSPRLFDGAKHASQRGEAGFADGVKPTSPEPSYEPSIEPLAPAARKRDELWEAAVEEFHGGQPVTQMERGRLNRALKALREVGATPDELKARARAYRKMWPDVACTPMAVASNWSTLAGKKAVVVARCRECWQPLDAHDEELCETLTRKEWL